MVITIYKLPVGSFSFLQCLSGTELLDLSGTPYIYLSKWKASDFRLTSVGIEGHLTNAGDIKESYGHALSAELDVLWSRSGELYAMATQSSMKKPSLSSGE
jgi:hypothetical protein